MLWCEGSAPPITGWFAKEGNYRLCFHEALCYLLWCESSAPPISGWFAKKSNIPLCSHRAISQCNQSSPTSLITRNISRARFYCPLPFFKQVRRKSDGATTHTLGEICNAQQSDALRQPLYRRRTTTHVGTRLGPPTPKSVHRY